MIFDLVDRSLRLVGEGGVVVSAADPSVADAAREHGLRGVDFVVEPSRRGLVELGQRVDAGELRPVAEPENAKASTG